VIRIHSRNKRAAADPRPRPRGHWDRPGIIDTFNNYTANTEQNVDSWKLRKCRCRSFGRQDLIFGSIEWHVIPQVAFKARTKQVRPVTHYPHVTWAHVMLRVHLGYFNIEFWRRLTLLSTLLTSRDLTWSSGRLVSAHLSNFYCRTHFVRHDVRVECSSTLLLVVSRNGGIACWKSAPTDFLYDTKSPDYRDQHMTANVWEEIGKELKIKRKTWGKLRWREDSVSTAFGMECP
jgi:hypothetical protein